MSAIIITPAFRDVHPLVTRRIQESELPWLPMYGHSDLPRVRSILIESALGRGAQRVLFVDADTVPDPGALGWLAHDAPVTPSRAVWGLYPLREGDRWSVHPAAPEDALRAIDEGRPFRIQSGGLGLACVSRESLLRVAKDLPRIVEETGTYWHPFCVPIVDAYTAGGGPRYYADDGSLCVRLRRENTELWCYPQSARASHAVERVIRDITPRD
jgi:hypothetical protein